MQFGANPGKVGYVWFDARTKDGGLYFLFSIFLSLVLFLFILICLSFWS